MATKGRRAPTIDLAQFTETVATSLLRASEARKRPFGPILVGIIWWPEGMEPGQMPRPLGNAQEGGRVLRARRG